MAKYKINDRVMYKGEIGTVTEVAEHTSRWFEDGNEQWYSVRRDPWPKTKDGKRYQNPATGEVRDHAADSFGCVPESEISLAS